MLFRSIFTTEFSLNIFFTLFFGLFTIFLYDKLTDNSFSIAKNKKIDKFYKTFFAILCFLIIGISAEITKFDYGFYGIFIKESKVEKQNILYTSFTIFIY